MPAGSARTRAAATQCALQGPSHSSRCHRGTRPRLNTPAAATVALRTQSYPEFCRSAFDTVGTRERDAVVQMEQRYGKVRVVAQPTGWLVAAWLAAPASGGCVSGRRGRGAQAAARSSR
jgi:hypothetical protein